MKRILFVGFLLLSLMVCFTSPAWAGGLDDCKFYKEGENALSEKGNYNYDEQYAKVLDLYTQAILTCGLSQKDLSKVYYRSCRVWLMSWAFSNREGALGIAIADCTRAIELDPKFTLAYIYRGSAWYYKGDYDKAIADDTTAIESGEFSQKDLSIIYNNRGLAWDKKGVQDKAKADYAKAKELGYK